MKRDEMIGRAAWDARQLGSHRWQDLGPDEQTREKDIALAAVAEARRIDTCETCRHRQVAGDVTHYYECRLFETPTAYINDVGCNRHEPKGE